ncbi:MAG: hypothetical protein IT423_07985, partial [Pirellulaceae bacterium]|nr:hypothetical protein [Pirellulaceae bacterium]
MPRLVYKNAVLALLVVLYVSGAALQQAGAQTARQVTIKCLDQLDQPLADVSVSVVLQTGDRDSLGDTPRDLPANLPANSPNDSSADLSADKPTASAPAAVFTTDAQGEVTIDTHQLKLANPDAAVTLYGWKPGYRFCMVSVQKQATLRLYPQEMRTFQILDHQGQPVAGAEVELSASPALRAIPSWTSQSPRVTDSMGVVRLPVSAEALAASITVRTSAGVSFNASLLSISFFRMLDPRDLTVVRLTETGRLQGTVPAQLAKQYRLQLQLAPDMSRQGLGRSWALVRPDIQIDANGRFDVPHVSAGKYWLTIERRLPFTPDSPEAAGQPESSQLLDGPREVLIQAGQTTSLELKQASGARVTGTLVSTESDVDYSNLRVSFNRIISTGDSSNRMMQGRTATAVCNALGQYQAELLPGDYGVSLDTSNDFQQRQSQNFIVGPGAATVTVDDVSIIKTSPIQVRLVDAFSQDFLSTPNGLLSVGMVAKDGEQKFCALTADGYGRAYLSAPLNEMEITLRNLKHPTLNCRLIDRDPGKDMELVIDRQTQGQEGNVQLRGRVVDPSGVGLAGVPLQLTLTYHAMPTGQTSVVPMSMSRSIFGRMVTQADGSISLPPMQVFKATTLSRSLAPQMANSSFKIKFTFLLTADGAVGEVSSRHEIEVDPARWQSTPEIVFPDIVLPKRPEFQTVVGRLTDQQSQPLAGKIVWLSHDLSMIRALTDPDGQVQVEKVADPAWLLCEQDWSVRRLGDLSKPIELKSLSDQKTDSATEVAAVPAPASASESITLKTRLSLEERRKLAKEQIDQLPNQQRFGLLRTLPLDAYLDPDKYFQTLRQRRNDISDSVRLSFIDFWNNLSDEQLEQLAEAMSDDNSRAAVYWILANRHPSQAAYEKVAELLTVPKSAVPGMLLDENSVDLFGKVLVKLHRYSAVEPYYEKMQAYIH